MKTTPTVRNMMSDSGTAVPNQFTIHTEEGVYFQSYDTIIAYRPYNGKTVIDENKWDYSQTTGKYRNRFLGEKMKETVVKIESGVYELDNLN